LDAAARILFARVGLPGHNALFDFDNQANVRVDPQTSYNSGENEGSNWVAILRNFGIVQIVDFVHIIDRNVDAESVVDDIPNDDNCEHPNVVETGPQQRHDGHDLNRKSDYYVQMKPVRIFVPLRFSSDNSDEQVAPISSSMPETQCRPTLQGNLQD
jgi:hypothetical protein